MLSLEGIEYHQGDEEAAQTREDMIQSLRFRDENEKLCHVSPPYIRLWTELLGSWPSLTNGGCRFLLQCRQWLPVQMRALARAKIQWSDGRVIQSPKESDLVYSRFGLTPEQIGDQSWSEPVPGILRMMRPPGIMAGVVNFDMGMIKSSILGKACSGIGRSQRWCILEWVMLTPENLKKFFIRMLEDEGFRRFYQNLFDLMRLVHMRLFNEKAPVVEPVNKALSGAVLLSLASEERGLETALEQVRKRKERINWLKGLTQDWEMKERTRWREVVPGVLAAKTRTGVKRSWSQSKAKPGQLKQQRKRTRLAKLSTGSGEPQDLSCPAPSQLGLGLPGLESELGALDDSLEEVEVAGIPTGVPTGVPDEAGPVVKPGPAKRMSAASRRSLRDGPRVLTYDEIIEGEDRAEAAFPDELEFQFKIPPEERF